jgi:hypothetical protein
MPASPPVPAATGRTRLSGPATYYVSAAGSDSTGDGSQAAPWARPDHAYTWCRDNLDLAGQLVTVQLLTSISGSQQVFTGPLFGQAAETDFVIQGNPSNPGVVTCSSLAIDFLVQDDARLSVVGVTVSAGEFGFVSNGGVFNISNIYFNSVGNACLDADGARSVITASGPLTWLHAQTFMTAATAEMGAQINLQGPLVISGSPTFTEAFLQADLGGRIDFSGAQISVGAAVGSQYSALNFGIVFSGLPPGTHCPLPGNAPGVVDGGYYQ